MSEPTADDLMTEPVLTIAEDEALADAATAMVEQEIKSVVVIDDDCSPTGVFTSTDVMQAVAHGRDPAAVTVAEYMSSDVVTAETGDDATAVARQMADDGIHHVPIVDDDGTVKGILTASDCTALVADQPVLSD